MHPRKAIRLAICDRLKGRTAARGRVYASQVAPVDTGDDDELPAILVYSRVDKLDPDTSYGADGTLSHAQSDLRVVVAGLVRGGETVDDDLDDLAGEIEAALDDWDIPGFENARLRLGDTEIDVVAEGVERPIGVVDMLWQVKYFRPWRGDGASMPDDVRSILLPEDEPA